MTRASPSTLRWINAQPCGAWGVAFFDPGIGVGVAQAPAWRNGGPSTTSRTLPTGDGRSAALSSLRRETG